MADNVSTLSLDVDRKKIPHEFIDIANTAPTKVTYEVLDRMKQIRKIIKAQDYSGKQDFLIKLNGKITAGESRHSLFKSKELMAKYLVMTNNYTKVCEWCTVKRTYTSYQGLLLHVKTSHYLLFDTTPTPSRQEQELIRRLECVKLTDKELDLTTWVHDDVPDVVMELPTFEEALQTMSMETEVVQAVENIPVEPPFELPDDILANFNDGYDTDDEQINVASNLPLHQMIQYKSTTNASIASVEEPQVVQFSYQVPVFDATPMEPIVTVNTQVISASQPMMNRATQDLFDLVNKVPEDEPKKAVKRMAAATAVELARSKLTPTKVKIATKSISINKPPKSKEYVTSSSSSSSASSSEDEVAPPPVKKIKVLTKHKPAPAPPKKAAALPRRRGPKTKTEEYKIKDAKRKGGEKDATSLASKAEILVNTPHTTTIMEELAKRPEEDYSVPELDKIFQQPNASKEVKLAISKFLVANKLTNTSKSDPEDPSKKKTNHLKSDINVLKPLSAYAKASVTLDYYSKASNVIGDNLTTWFDAYFQFHATNISAETRKQNKAAAIAQGNGSRTWKEAIKGLLKHKPGDDLSAFDDPKYQSVPILVKIIGDIKRFFSPIHTQTENQLKQFNAKFNKYQLSQAFLVPLVPYTPEDELAYKQWMKSDALAIKNINLTPKFKSSMVRILSVLKDAKNPMNQFTRLSRTQLKAHFSELVAITRNELLLERFGNNLEQQNINVPTLTFGDRFYDNLMVMLMKFAFRRYNQILFMSKVTKRGTGAGLVEAGVVDTLTRKNDLTKVSDFYNNCFDNFYTSDRIAKTLTQMQVLACKNFCPSTVEDIRQGFQDRNPELLDMFSTKCSEIIFPVIRNNMFNLLCNVAKNIVSVFMFVSHQPDVTWDLYQNILFRHSYYEYPGDASFALEFPPIADDICATDYWLNLCDAKKSKIFSELFLSNVVVEEMDEEFNGVESHNMSDSE